MKERKMKHKLICVMLILEMVLIAAWATSQGMPRTSAADSVIVVQPGGSIQEAINSASEGQTILVEQGEYAIEYPILVNKTVILTGESRDNTIIDGQSVATAICNILADNAEVRNLTLMNGQISYSYGVHVKNATQAKIENCHINNCTHGIYATNSSNCQITRNLIEDNYFYGIYIAGNSSSNEFFWNTIQNDNQGVSIDLPCTKNLFYQNNFVQNSPQIAGLGAPANFWNKTYPVCGNYWSDYASIDVKNGHNQNQNGSDGIADQAFQQSGATDFYPIMGYINVFHAYLLGSTSYYVSVSSNSSTISDFLFACPGSFINFTLSANPKSGFCRVAIPKGLLGPEDSSWSIVVGGVEPGYLFVENDDYSTYLGFTYNVPSTEIVKIQGTYCLPELQEGQLLIAIIIIMTLVVMTRKSHTDGILSRLQT
jgi:parallel beta-helix repeat protein